MILDVVEIQKILPHRYPFLMVDAILEMESLKRIVGVKNVTINESYFQGHFPGQPIMPGVLIIESMAQTGGLLLLKEVPDRERKLLYFVAVDGARFRRPVVPGDQLKVEMKVVSWRGDFCKLEGKATVEGQLAAEATLMCKMVDRAPASKAEARNSSAGRRGGKREAWRRRQDRRVRSRWRGSGIGRRVCVTHACPGARSIEVRQEQCISCV
jgi:3-hydroxyacyl-[acyl-carrier-protein] dehydratase